MISWLVVVARVRPSGSPSQCAGSTMRAPRPTARGCTASSVTPCSSGTVACRLTVAAEDRTSTSWRGNTLSAGTQYRLASNATRQSLPTCRRCRSATTYGLAGTGPSAA